MHFRNSNIRASKLDVQAAQAIWFEIVVKQCDFQREHFVFVSFPAFWP